MPIITDLIEHGYVLGRPVIGISGRIINDATAQMHGWVPGIQIMAVMENSGAHIAGLQRGDIITKFNDKPVLNIEDTDDIKKAVIYTEIFNRKEY